MAFKEILQGLNRKNKEKKEKFREADEDFRIQRAIEERQKSANERELDRFEKEDREERIKEALEQWRKRRDNEIRFEHNPLNTPNITNHVDWEVLKERNMFKKKGNMFVNQPYLHKDNPKLLMNNRSLYGV